MFAFAIAGAGQRRIVLARDRLGIKPLYLDQTPDRLRFASTLPALLAGGGTDTSLDRTALQHYMSFHSVVPAPRTILNGVRKLPPATVRIVEPDGAVSDHVYWRPEFTRDPAEADWTSEQTGRTRSSTACAPRCERRMVADVPVGVLLSGGIDSSLVVALLAEAGQTDLMTFSIGFEAAGGESGDEFEYSDIVAQHFGTKHHQIHDRQSSRLLPGIDAAIAAMSEPMVSHDCVAFYLLSRGRLAGGQGRAVRPGRRRGPRRLRLVPAAGSGCRATDAVEAYAAGLLRPAARRRCRACCSRSG